MTSAPGRSARLAALLVGVGALWLAACSDEATLSGSLSDFYRLDHQEVRARQYRSELAIEYVDLRGAVPVRVSIRTDERLPKTDKRYDLTTQGDVTGSQVDGTEIPRLVSGSLRLDAYAHEHRARIQGSFNAEFDVGRDRPTLSGSFDTKLELVEWPPVPEDDAGPADSAPGDAGAGGDASATD